MKKSFLLTAVMLIILSVSAAKADAQSRYGVIGGFSFSHASDINNRGSMTKYSAGVTYQLKLPLGFSVQPSLIYHVKGTRPGEIQGEPGVNMDITAGYLELPVSFQWGPDLLLFRPFLDVTPFIGVGINNHISGSATGKTLLDERNLWGRNGIARMEYGLGLGVGIEVWRFQVIGRYNWNFGPLYKGGAADNTAEQWFLDGALGNGGNFRALTLSLAFLF